MCRRKKETQSFTPVIKAPSQIGTVIAKDMSWHGNLSGEGGVRIEGSVTGEIVVRGTVVIGETGKVNCETLKAETLIVAGLVQGNVVCQKLEIRATGRIWGDVVTTSFSSEDGAFLRGTMRMEEKIEIAVPKEGIIAPDTSWTNENDQLDSGI
ncbi:MAG TPA: polymer-forming cytoskeletal protein [Anaerolineaceae bacterium]|nr:polymer-forming cytoskeletal protein [Anaerolineaceae bacterium]